MKYETAMDNEALLQRATEHIFSTGLDDGGARLGLANMRYGLAKIHLAQQALGLIPDATFIAAPDLTVTRNHSRWRSGFGYGGRLTWGDGQQELVILDLKPNCCGMLVGGLDQRPARDTLLHRVIEIQIEELYIDGIPLKWDFGQSNHFITLSRVTPLGSDESDSTFLPYAFVFHGAGGELRGETALGDGLYWDRSEALQRKAEAFETPFGPLHLLTGQAARDYYAFCQLADDFAKKRRLLVAHRLFPDMVLYSNEAHQGLASMNDMILGTYLVREGDAGETGTVFPLTLRAQLPAYLVRGHSNLSDTAIERLGLGKRARRLGLYDRLRSANVLPHGGGYAYPHIRNVVSVIELGQERCFELDVGADSGRQIISDTRDLPFAYRGMEVVERVVELGLGELVARLDPIYVLKI